MPGYRIGRNVFDQTLDFAENSTVVSTTTDTVVNGLLRQVIVTTPATVDSSATATVTIKDSSGYTIYTGSGIAANTTDVDLLTADTLVPIGSVITVTVTYSQAQTANRASTVVLLVEK